MIVRARAWVAPSRLACIILWWAHVTETPEASRTAVFRSGTSNGFNGVMPVGGQHSPTSGVGARLAL